MKIVRYEDILPDPARAFVEIMAHFGVEAEPDRVARAVELSTVERVNKTFGTMITRTSTRFSGGSGGGSGKWRDVYTPEQIALFNDRAGPVLSALGYSL